MVTPWLACASIGAWLLMLLVGQPGLEEKSGSGTDQQIAKSAQQQTSEPPQSNGVVENDEQEEPITANAGKFVIKVTETDAIDQMTLGLKPTSNPAANMLLEQVQNGSVQNSSSSFQRNEQSFGGNGNASGSAGGFSGGFAGGSGSTSGSVTSGRSGALVRPNLAVAMKVDSSDKGIFELENMKAVDDQGNPVQWMGPGSFNFYDSAFEKGRSGEMIVYFQEENDTEYLTISGVLKVTPGRRIEVEFTNGEPATRKSGGHTFVLKDVQVNDRGIHVSLALPQIIKKRGNQFGNAEAMMKSILEQQDAFEILIQDSEGVFHYPSSSGSAGGSGNAGGSAGGFASGFSGGSAGESKGESGGRTFGQEAQSNSTQSYTFGGLPDGREIRSVIVRATEKTGKPQTHPFKLQKVPVPYKGS
jgi:uncharacterized membrane protein YgcG